MKKILLFDADGVLTLPEEIFSVVYARSRGLDLEQFRQFFRQEWKDIVTGKRDLKESIASHPELWRWSGTVEELLAYWFEHQDVRNDSLLKLIGQLRSQGTPCYLATEQEKYRGNYMREVMFKDVFDGYFITAELGVSKTEPAFFQMILDNIGRRYSDIPASNVIFFDDSQDKIDTATTVGIDARLYTGIDQVQELLAVNR